ncbi:putative beta-glucosidase [Trichinella spiralis]|uniref:Beta-glucosidase n=1 Tax=Trichinella spiralis TaxID=6334 RepID=A0ABR3K7J7_TRISP|nr:hypothetical protein Tsp_11244 [Trichinella spiralis]
MPQNRSTTATLHALMMERTPTTVPVPAYNAAEPRLWFELLEVFFEYQNVVDESRKLYMAVSAMPDEAIIEFRDILIAAVFLQNPFTTFRLLYLRRILRANQRRTQ